VVRNCDEASKVCPAVVTWVLRWVEYGSFDDSD
jgi:hypothetical protein